MSEDLWNGCGRICHTVAYFKHDKYCTVLVLPSERGIPVPYLQSLALAYRYLVMALNTSIYIMTYRYSKADIKAGKPICLMDHPACCCLVVGGHFYPCRCSPYFFLVSCPDGGEDASLECSPVPTAFFSAAWPAAPSSGSHRPSALYSSSRASLARYTFGSIGRAGKSLNIKLSGAATKGKEKKKQKQGSWRVYLALEVERAVLLVDVKQVLVPLRAGQSNRDRWAGTLNGASVEV